MALKNSEMNGSEIRKAGIKPALFYWCYSERSRSVI